MPIYEYSCPSCGHDFEQIVKVNAPAPPCPECGGGEVGKKISLAAFHLKGGGWYSDAYSGKDNKAPGSSTKASSESSSSTASSGSSESKSSSDSGSSTSSSSSTGSSSSSSSSSSSTSSD